ncbi:MAG TPA: homoserine O-acetyltransferase [Candidatus Bathyarchaeia archaeon]|nr:homoserine O-acetyltransferase [Candidatus Bathyarchaeia archaeon]
MAEPGSVGVVETKVHTFAESPNEMALDCGRRLGPITLAYETYGTLNADQSNAVLILHALSGDAHVAGYHSADKSVDESKPGWWDAMVGPDKGFDTNKYFVICSNMLGGCRGSTGPGSVDPATGKPYGLSFPIITVADIVRAQQYLIDHLGIKRLLAVAGGSMGGMQALEWAVRYPARVKSALIIASTHRSGAQEIAFNAVGRHAILGDKTFEAGDYYDSTLPTKGLSIARMLAHITYLSQQSMHAKFGRALRSSDQFSYDFDSEFSVETYLDYQGQQFVNRFDANSYLYITKAIDYFDIGAEFGSLEEATARIEAKTLVLSYSSDWLYPPAQSEEMVYALMRNRKDVTYCNIESAYGHDAFLLEVDVMERIIRGFLENAADPSRPCKKTAACACKASDQTAPAPASPNSIYAGRRIDYDRIIDLVEPGSRVLDIGCGNGVLLCRLIREKQVQGAGIELAQENLISCVECGISVIQADVGRGLRELPDGSFDYAVLSMTLQVIEKPEAALREMLRVGKKCVVSFPNFAFWKVRLKSLFAGRAPVTRNLPYAWHTTPNRHVLSIKDFRQFCEANGANIIREIPISSHGRRVRTTSLWPNLLADEAVFVISAK